MKKEIIALVKSEEGTYRMNNISFLKRWTKSGLDEDVDMLELNFDNINHVNYGYSTVEIKSRDYEGIINECIAATEDYLSKVAERLAKDLRAGYNPF